MRLRSWPALAACALFSADAAVARVRADQRDDGLLASVCTFLQQSESGLLYALYLAPTWGDVFELLAELETVGELWDAVCADTYGSIARDAPAPGVPALFDGDGDVLFDEDELVWGLDPASPDTDRDGLDDGVDPSWLADLLASEGQARLASIATGAETSALAGDRSGAADALAEVQAALGGCEPDPVTFDVVGPEGCVAARGLEGRLRLR